MKKEDNPFCVKCGFRIFPQWGVHRCTDTITDDELKRIRHAAGDLIANLHFYRLPADFQCAALAEALAFTMAANVHPARLKGKWDGVQIKMLDLMQTQLWRQARGTNGENLVMDVARPRLRAKMTRSTKEKKSEKLQARSHHRRR